MAHEVHWTFTVKNRYPAQMSSGAYQLSDVTAEKIVIVCDQCNRRAVLSTARLVVKHGGAIGLPELIQIEARSSCAGSGGVLGGCKARFSPETVASWLIRKG